MRERPGRAGRAYRYGAIVLITVALTLLLSRFTPSIPAAADPNALKVQGPDTLGTPMPIFGVPPLTGGTQVPVMDSATGTNSSITATLAGAAGKTTYICGFSFHYGSATAASTQNVTVSGVSTTLNFRDRVPSAISNQNDYPIGIYFNPPLPASGVNTAIVVTVPAAGAGDTGTSVSAWGFQQ